MSTTINNLGLYKKDITKGSGSYVCSKHGPFELDVTRPYGGAIVCPGCVKSQSMDKLVSEYFVADEYMGSDVKWHHRFMNLAKMWTADCSKDPSTKVGAALVSPDRRQVILGYNGFPPGVHDHPERYADRTEKYARVVHAESNALDNALCSVKGWTIYVHPLLPCSGRDGGHNCAGRIITRGISRVIIPVSALTHERWGAGHGHNTSLEMFKEAGVEVVAISDD